MWIKEVKSYSNPDIKLFLIGTSINSILVFPYRSPYEYFVWISVLYICSIHISDYQKKQLFIK